MILRDCVKFDQNNTPLGVAQDMPIQDIYEKMKGEGVKAIPVIDGQAFLGFVDLEGILNAVMLSHANFTVLKAKDLLKKNDISLQADSPLVEVLESFKASTAAALPMYDGDRFVKLLSQADLLTALAHILEKDQNLFEEAEAKGELFMANPLVQRLMSTLSDLGI